jgi:type I restriction enzyme S subunit
MKTAYKDPPKGWEIKKISDLCENLDSKRIPVSRESREKGSIPYYGATGVVDHVSNYIFDEDLLLVGEDGADWSKFANTAYLIHGKSWVNNHAHVLRCTGIDQVFLKEYLNYQDLNSFIAGGTRGKLTQADLSRILVPVPPKNEQKKITEIFLSVDEEINKTHEIITQTEKVKKGLTRQIFTKGIGHTVFKKTEFGNIPIEWSELRLGELATITRGGSPRPIEDYITDASDGLNWLKIGDIEPGAKYITRTTQKIKHAGLSKTTLVRNGDFILSNSMSFGRPYIMKIDACIHDGWLAFKDIKADLIIVDYLYYLLSSEVLQDIFRSVAAGSGVKNLKKESVSNIFVALPPPEEQQKITDIFSSIDEKISFNQKIKERLMMLKKGLMQDLLDGRVRTKV